MWRYAKLRRAIATLAASADEQHAWLEEIFAPVTKGLSAWGYGNDELALELNDIYLAARLMVEEHEISEAQAEAPRALDAFLEKWSGKENADFWVREALWADPRWEEARQLARIALAEFPPEPV